MNSGVRPSRTIDPNGFARRESTESAFQLALYRPGPSLQLEAGKVSSVVFDPCAVTDGAALSGALSGASLSDGRWLQTSSSWTIGAASPARGPSLMMRV